MAIILHYFSLQLYMVNSADITRDIKTSNDMYFLENSITAFTRKAYILWEGVSDLETISF